LENLGVDGRIISDLTESGLGDVSRMHLAQNRDEWWDTLNAVMN